MHGIEVQYSWRIETKDQCPCTSPLYLRHPFGYVRHALPKSAHDLETHSYNPSCAKPNVRPGDRPTRGSGGPHHPAQDPQGCPPARGHAPSPRPGPNHLREGGLPPGIGHALPNPLDPAPLATRGDRALGLGHPHRPHTSRGRPGLTTKPPPPDRSSPSPAGTTPSTGSSTARVLAQS